MTPEQVTAVKSTWESVKPISEKAAELFYGKLFELDPSLKPLFKTGDMKEQGRKLMATIGVAVSSLDRLDEILSTVQALGNKHTHQYKVPDSSYKTVGQALLWTLGQGLGDAFTDDVKEAWTLTYTTLADVMIAAGKEPAMQA